MSASTSPLPRLALSVRQPWAWAIVFRGKDIENRSWRHPNPGLTFRGEFAVHAAKGMTRDEYDDAAEFMARIGVVCPPAGDLLRAGIIGTAVVRDIVRESTSQWFMGPRGLVLAEARSVELIPSVGQLGFFEWSQADASILPTPARWMLPLARAAAAPTVQGSLF